MASWLLVNICIKHGKKQAFSNMALDSQALLFYLLLLV